MTNPERPIHKQDMSCQIFKAKLIFLRNAANVVVRATVPKQSNVRLNLTGRLVLGGHCYVQGERGSDGDPWWAACEHVQPGEWTRAHPDPHLGRQATAPRRSGR